MICISKTEAVIGYDATVLISAGSQAGASCPAGARRPWFLSRQSGSETFGGISGYCGPQIHACPFWLWDQPPTVHRAAVSSPPQTASAPWARQPHPSPLGNLSWLKCVCLEPKPLPGSFLSIHSRVLNTFIPLAAAGHLISNLQSQVFSTFSIVNVFLFLGGYAK